MRERSEQDPRLLIELLFAFRDVGAWDDVLRAAEVLAEAARDEERVVQLLALAHVRRGTAVDVEQAIRLLRRFLSRHPEDGTGWSLLRGAYRERWASTGERHSLDLAIDSYQRAREIDRDTYAASKLSALFARRGDHERLQSLLPVARAFAAEELASGRPDFWPIANALELAALAGDAAAHLAMQAREAAPGEWALASFANTHRQRQLDGRHAGSRWLGCRDLTSEREPEWG